MGKGGKGKGSSSNLPKGKGKGKSAPFGRDGNTLSAQKLDGMRITHPKLFDCANVEPYVEMHGEYVKVSYWRELEGQDDLKLTSEDCYKVYNLLKKKEENTGPPKESDTMLKRFKASEPGTSKTLGTELHRFDVMVTKVMDLAKSPGKAITSIIKGVTTSLNEAHKKVFETDGLANVWIQKNLQHIPVKELGLDKWLAARTQEYKIEAETFDEWLFPKKVEKYPYYTRNEINDAPSWAKKFLINFEEIGKKVAEKIDQKYAEKTSEDAKKQEEREKKREKAHSINDGFKWYVYPYTNLYVSMSTFSKYTDVDNWFAETMSAIRDFNSMRAGYWSHMRMSFDEEERLDTFIVQDPVKVQAIWDQPTKTSGERRAELLELSKSPAILRESTYGKPCDVLITPQKRFMSKSLSEACEIPEIKSVMSLSRSPAQFILDEAGLGGKVKLETEPPIDEAANIATVPSTTLAVPVEKDLTKKVKYDKDDKTVPETAAFFMQTKQIYSTEKCREVALYLAQHTSKGQDIIFGVLMYVNSTQIERELCFNWKPEEGQG